MEWVGEQPPGFKITIIQPTSLSNDGRAIQFAQSVPSLLKNRKIDAMMGFNKMPGLDVYYAGDPCYIERIRRKTLSPYKAILRLTPRYRNFRWLEHAVFHPGSSTQILLLTASEEQCFRKHYGTQVDRFQVLPPGILRIIQNIWFYPLQRSSF